MIACHPMSRRSPGLWGWTVCGLMLGGLLLSGSGCTLLGFVAAGAQEYERSRPRKVEAEYTGLQGRTFAVVVAADRLIQSEHAGVVEELTMRITERLEQESGASGRVRGERLLAYLYDNPRWIAMPRGELATQLGVDRLVFVELLEYQLNDPGNQYLWKGVAAGTVGVIEADGPLPDEFAFERALRVTFPDKEGYGPGELAREAIASVLIKRFTDRASWLFYTHEERGDQGY